MKTIADQLEEIRPGMLRFALLQLRDRATAEDAVQEALVAALAAAGRFEPRARLRTWVFAILKRKIVDILRQHYREPLAAEPSADPFEPLFDEGGHWRPEDRPAAWGDPLQALENAQFWRIFDACLDHLPENRARVFMMREFLGLETEEICQSLGMSQSNCWVLLHRARMGLRLCLESHWYQNEGDRPC
ncbi:MAG: RNA polymerase subunit sigma [Gammaproteobacteria bacterium RIFOXYA12_FULL_61_12]|nr:MAG: RNA polymerase subunit sigma [Gammaproteobacteria bacterium RIFOXYD12_FULL_61_37]OGT93983.1 MAG: RNA polymerase subunit sigma [Gammaproteobacteria bacterium RIFOXYA12_FULL_61_12]